MDNLLIQTTAANNPLKFQLVESSYGIQINHALQVIQYWHENHKCEHC